MKRVVLLLLLVLSPIFAFEHLTVENIDEKLKGKNVILDFYASWCPPCKIVNKNLVEYDKSKPSNVTIYKVDIDAQRALVKTYNIRSIPTVLFIQDGKIAHSKVGLQSLDEIKSNTKKYLQ